MPMSGEIEYGVVSFCPDLTDPAAPSVPVAVIGLLGEKSHANGEGNGKIFMIARADAEDLLPIEDDPLARAILNDLPDFLGEQVREGLRIAGASGLISWIEHSLRNSLHISNIQCSNVDMAVDDHIEFMNRMAEIISEVFDEEIPEDPFAGGLGRRTPQIGVPNMQLWDPASLENKGSTRSGVPH